MIEKIIQIPIYNQRLGFVLTDDTEAAQKRFPEVELNNHVFATTIRGSVKKGKHKLNCIYLLFNIKNEVDKITIGVVAHEANHAAAFLFQIAGIELDIDNDEPFCYLSQYIADLTADFLKKNGWKP